MSCSICSRDDAESLGRALRAAAAREPGAESLNAISKRTGVRKETLIRHRDECPEAPAQVVRTAADHPSIQAEPAEPAPTSPRPLGEPPAPSLSTIRRAEIEEQCVALRVRGKSYADIAREVGIDTDTAIDAVERVLLRKRRGADAKADLVRKLELERIDRLIEGLWDRATDPAMASVDVPADTETGVRAYDGQDKAVDRVLKAMERKAKLEGLDVPTGPSMVVNVLQAPGVLDLLREVRGFLLTRAPDLLPELDEHLRGVTARRLPGRAA